MNQHSIVRLFLSLSAFLKLFERALSKGEKSTSADQTVRHLKTSLLKVSAFVVCPEYYSTDDMCALCRSGKSCIREFAISDLCFLLALLRVCEPILVQG